MKSNLFFLPIYLFLMSCSKEFPAKITKLEVSIFESVDGKKVISIHDHPLGSFNGKYLEQSVKINDTSYFRNQNNRYLYFYDQAEGGEKGWSLDHRKPDGIKDHFSGGWFYLEKFQELDESCVNWLSVDQGLFHVIENASVNELQEWINDGANPKVVMEYTGMSLIDYAKELKRDDIIKYLISVDD
ncbi:MAG: hypothetical protein CMI23_10960 [Opitutae bacterium]|nr:hypothetical protein [Opitutae bacterium]|tara:strand:- start:182 stop:739 length:558 start_codon:yes stop_codon:yes gene_type:complete